MVLGVIMGGVGILKIKYMREDRKPKFSYERISGNDVWRIMIHSPNKIIHKFSISIDGEKIPVENSSYRLLECTLKEGEGVNFVVPTNVSENSKIILKFDQFKESMKYKDIPLYRNNF